MESPAVAVNTWPASGPTMPWGAPELMGRSCAQGKWTSVPPPKPLADPCGDSGAEVTAPPKKVAACPSTHGVDGLQPAACAMQAAATNPQLAVAQPAVEQPLPSAARDSDDESFEEPYHDAWELLRQYRERQGLPGTPPERVRLREIHMRQHKEDKERRRRAQAAAAAGGAVGMGIGMLSSGPFSVNNAAAPPVPTAAALGAATACGARLWVAAQGTALAPAPELPVTADELVCCEKAAIPRPGSHSVSSEELSADGTVQLACAPSAAPAALADAADAACPGSNTPAPDAAVGVAVPRAARSPRQQRVVIPPPAAAAGDGDGRRDAKPQQHLLLMLHEAAMGGLGGEHADSAEPPVCQPPPDDSVWLCSPNKSKAGPKDAAYEKEAVAASKANRVGKEYQCELPELRARPEQSSAASDADLGRAGKPGMDEVRGL